MDLDRSSGPDIIRYKYTLQEQDVETGLYNYRARYYGAASGSFTSADSLVPNSKDAGSYNRYGYVKGNPLKYVDPTGHFAVGAGYSGGFYPSSDAVEGFFEAAGHWLWVNTGVNSFETGLLPGYDFMGKGNKGYESKPNSYMDSVAREHDNDYFKANASIFSEVFTLDDSTQWSVIGADLEFIGKYFFGMITGKMFVDNFRQHGFWGGLEWIAKDLFFGGLGTLLFTFQIFGLMTSIMVKGLVRGINYAFYGLDKLGEKFQTGYKKAVDGLGKFGRRVGKGLVKLFRKMGKWRWKPRWKKKKYRVEMFTSF